MSQGECLTCSVRGLQWSRAVRMYTLLPSKPWSCHAGADALVSKALSAWGVMALSSSGLGSQSLYRISIAGSISARPLEGLWDWMNGGYAPPTASNRLSPSRVLQHEESTRSHPINNNFQRATKFELYSHVPSYVNQPHDCTSLTLSRTTGLVETLCRAAGYYAAIRVGENNEIPLLI